MPAQEPNLDFFSSSAQVIPLLFIALAFEFRAERAYSFLPALFVGTAPEPKNEKQRSQRFFAAVYAVVVSAALFAGEAVCLYVLAVETPSATWKWAVAASMAIGGLGLVVPIGLIQYTRLVKYWPGKVHAQQIEKKVPEEQIENIPKRSLQALAFITAIAALLSVAVAFGQFD